MIRKAALLLLMLALSLPAAKDYYMYVGTYTAGNNSKGIYLYRFDAQTGKVTPMGIAAESPNPSFLAIDPKNRFLYAANEAEDTISAFAIDRSTGKLTPLNKQPVKGKGPCFVTVDRSGRAVLAADYGDGTLAVFPLQKDGSLAPASATIQHTGKGADPQRQAGPHAHSINLSYDNKYAVAADLGIDRLKVYRFDSRKGTLTPAPTPETVLAAGSGPRHFVFHPNRRSAYVINELASTVTAFAFNSSAGTLEGLQTISTVPEGKDRAGNSTAEIQLHPSGRYLYGSNRGLDDIAVFKVDVNNGRLTPIENVSTQGKVPRNFRIDPTGRYLLAANQKSDSVVVFSIDDKTGRLSPTGGKIDVPAPVCIKFVPVK